MFLQTILLLVVMSVVHCDDRGGKVVKEVSDDDVEKVDDSFSSLRIIRSAFSNPVVTSMQTPIRGVSPTMFDATLGAARQSEGPRHPAAMRNAPPRKVGNPFIIDLDNLARPGIVTRRGGTGRGGSASGGSGLVTSEEEENSIMMADDPSYLMTIESLRLDDYEVNPQPMSLTEDLDVNRMRRLDVSGIHTRESEEISNYHLGRERPISSIQEDRQPSQSQRLGRLHPRFSGKVARVENNDQTEFSNVIRGNRKRRPLLFHGRSRERVNSVNNDEVNPNSQVTGSARSHPRFFRPKKPEPPPARPILNEPIAKSELSITDVMEKTNRTYEELTRILENKGISLGYLLRQLHNGISMDEVTALLNFTPEKSFTTTHPTTTETTPTQRTPKPILWDDFLANQHNTRNYSDPIYAKDVHPLMEDYDYNYGNYEDEYEIAKTLHNNEIEYDDEDSDEGHAKIHSFTMHEIIQKETSRESDGGQSNYLEYYNHLDQFPSSPGGFAGNEVLISKNVETESSSYQIVPEKHSSRPLTYTVIAAGGIMIAIAMLILFVLISYTIVKCTKKPVMNNYQVNDGKRNEVVVA